MSTKEDPQQQRAYDWEGDFTDWAPPRATKAEMLRVIRRCCRMYRVPAPAVFFLSKNRRNGKKLTSVYDPNKHAIYIRPRHMQKNTAIHEAAHAVIDWILGPYNESHGKEWVGVMMNLLSKFKIAPMRALKLHAKAMRVAFSPPGTTTPKQIRRCFAAKAKRAARERRLMRFYG